MSNRKRGCKRCRVFECRTHTNILKPGKGRIIRKLTLTDTRSRPAGFRGHGSAWKKHFGKALVSLLRHDNKQEVHARGLMDQSGWVSIRDALQVPSLRRFGGHYADVIAEATSVDVSDRSSKQRLEVKHENGIGFVRACQGHSLKLNFDKLLEQITPASKNWVRYGLHGTFRRNLKSIVSSGLDVKYSAGSSSKCRVHVHFAATLEDRRANAGVRKGTDTIVVCDLQQMHDSGITLYRSKNHVILTSGIDGCVGPEFITRIYDKNTGQTLYRPDFVSHLQR